LKVAEVMQTTQPDAQREAQLAVLVDNGGVAHLTSAANEWIVYWASSDRPLWICSQHRMPSRWNASLALATTRRRLLRMSAFPDDQLVAMWAKAPAPADAFAPIERAAIEGGSETIINLTTLTDQIASATGIVMEIR
jgi:hypothetical protein